MRWVWQREGMNQEEAGRRTWGTRGQGTGTGGVAEKRGAEAPPLINNIHFREHELRSLRPTAQDAPGTASSGLSQLHVWGESRALGTGSKWARPPGAGGGSCSPRPPEKLAG